MVIVIHPILEENARKANQWFEDYKGHPFFSHILQKEADFLPYQNKFHIRVYSSKKCLVCVEFFQNLMEFKQYNTELLEAVFLFAPILIFDVDSDEANFLDNALKLKPETYDSEKWGLPVYGLFQGDECYTFASGFSHQLVQLFLQHIIQWIQQFVNDK